MSGEIIKTFFYFVNFLYHMLKIKFHLLKRVNLLSISLAIFMTV